MRNSSKFHQHFLGFDLPECLGSEDMLDLTGPNSKGDGSKSSVGCRMAVSTDDEFSWLSSSSFWPNHVHNSLFFRTVGRMFNPKLLNIFSKLINLCFRNHISNIVDIDCRDIVVKGSKCQVWSSQSATCISQTLKGLRAGHFMNIVLVHIHELGLPLFSCDDMTVP